MSRSIAIIVAMTVALAATAAAAAQHVRVRGTIKAFDENSLTIASRSGDPVKLMIDSSKYVYVVPSDLSEISADTFIGAATKDVHGMPVAVEVVVFPESMAGMGEGHYPWDKLRDTTLTGTGTVSTSMTNATVESSSAAGQQAKADSDMMVSTAMTNATVKESTAVKAGTQTERASRLVTVTYGDGKEMQILIPPTAPIVAFKPKDRTILKQGAHVFIIAAKKDGKLFSALVAVGKDGLNPPM